ncbi:hypothetical protein AWU67_13665 [Microterricola viridarii]|uniref:Pyridoxamine 5'-phosphate oxidase N-terminal domain-containing protein n=2 Tax=Microterricola viridarii TaxID=412690 RepID=A0A120I1D1_9MICO|nr:hypothetical protein AWU67_13665 [Microterricola viridarii]
MAAYVRGIGSGVVSSLGPGGAPQAAYLDIAATDDGELVFNARVDSRKIANIARDGRVAVVIGGADGTTLQCEGSAALAAGEDLARCAAAYEAAFPGFVASRPGDGVMLVRVALDWARYRDYRDREPVSVDVDLGQLR